MSGASAATASAGQGRLLAAVRRWPVPVIAGSACGPGWRQRRGRGRCPAQGGCRRHQHGLVAPVSRHSAGLADPPLRLHPILAASCPCCSSMAVQQPPGGASAGAQHQLRHEGHGIQAVPRPCSSKMQENWHLRRSGSRKAMGSIEAHRAQAPPPALPAGQTTAELWELACHVLPPKTMPRPRNSRAGGRLSGLANDGP